MIPKIFTLHGIKNYDVPGAFHNYTASVFRDMGLDAEPIFYGHLNAAWPLKNVARFRNEEIAEELYERIPDGSILVGHSNAAPLIYLLDQKGKQFAGVVLVQPALDRKLYIKNTPWVYVYYNPKDWAVFWGSLLVGHLFGQQGRRGPDMTDWPDEIKAKYEGRVRNTLDLTDDMPEVSGHSWFDGELGLEFINDIAENIIDEYGI